MARVSSLAASELARILKEDRGLPSAVAALSVGSPELRGVAAAEVVTSNIAAELLEKATVLRYPVVHVYCAAVKNKLREKFRRFSGVAEMQIDVRVSQDRMDELEPQLHFYVDAITDVLDRNRGNWTDGLFYTGGYEASFGPVKKGGKNFIQTARVALEINVSID